MIVRKNVKWSLAVAAIFAISLVMNVSLLFQRPGAAVAYQDQCTLLNLYEGRIIAVKPDESLPFRVEFNLDNEAAYAWCKASGRAAELYLGGSIGEGSEVLVAVDLDTSTGVVVDMVYTKLFAEPAASEPSGEPVAPEEPGEAPAEEPTEQAPTQGEDGDSTPAQDGETDNQTTEPEPVVQLPPGVELVPGVEPGPTPGLQAPEGKVKLTVMFQPMGVEGITMYPPPGVYFVEKDRRVVFSCVSENPHWVFSEWYIGRGASGSTRKLGAGDEHITRVLLNVDTVVTAFHIEVL
ncbi:MAG: hypothetical protein ABIJ47_14730 [Candidatus Bathyarchaeota archaeon]